VAVAPTLVPRPFEIEELEPTWGFDLGRADRLTIDDRENLVRIEFDLWCGSGFVVSAAADCESEAKRDSDFYGDLRTALFFEQDLIGALHFSGHIEASIQCES